MVVSYVGFGNVGRACAYLTSTMDMEVHLNIIDPGDWISGSVIDLGSSLEARKNKAFSVNDYDLLEQSDVIIYSAGANQPIGESRLNIAQSAIKLAHDIFDDLKLKPDVKIIVISNPVDVISYHVWKAVGCAPEQIIGTGTWVDQIRLDYYLKQSYGVDTDKEHVRILGEHGDSMTLLYSLFADENFSEETRESLRHRVITTASEIRKTQEYTYYGVGRCAFDIMLAMLGQLDLTIPVSVLPQADYKDFFGTDELFISLPVRFENGDISQVNYLEQLTDSEKEKLKLSGEVILKHV